MKERIVRKDLEDPVTAERYRNNILDVFINSRMMTWLMTIFNKTALQPIQQTFRYLRQFCDRLINRDFGPANTPDLTPLDYYPFPH
jgi:hypothetical protein